MKKHFLARCFTGYLSLNLLYRIFFALIIGAVLGLLLGNFLEGAKLQQLLKVIAPFGTVFIRLLGMIMLPVIFSTLVVGASSVSPAQLGNVGVRIMAFYVFTSAVAIAVGLSMGYLFRPQADLTGITAETARSVPDGDITAILVGIIPNNVALSIVNGNILQVIFFGLIFGMAISFLKASQDQRIKKAAETVYVFFDGLAEIMMKIVKGVMQYAPIGVFALMFEVFATNGPKVIGTLAVLTAACFTGYAVHIVIVYIGLIKLVGLSGRRFIREAKEPFITGFVTRSSGGTLPITIQAAQRLGIHKEVYSFSLPLGAAINMDGTAIYQGVATCFIAFTVMGTGLTTAQILTVILTATLATIGTAGVPGAGAIMLLMVLESIGLPVEAGTRTALAYGMILGIDAILDMGRTALNVIGDLVYTTVVCKRMGLIDLDKWKN